MYIFEIFWIFVSKKTDTNFSGPMFIYLFFFIDFYDHKGSVFQTYSHGIKPPGMDLDTKNG